MLAHVEGEWKAQAHVFAECKENSELPICKEAPAAFHKSCAGVVSALMLGSLGKRDDTKEYMTDVCSSMTVGETDTSKMNPWKKTSCTFLGATVISKMSGNDAENREHHVRHANRACDTLWSHFVVEQGAEESRLVKASVEADKRAAEAVAEESNIALAKAQNEKKAEAEDERHAKLQEEADAKASKKRLEDAKKKVTKSFDEQKAKVAKKVTVENNIENAFKIHNAKVSKKKVTKKKVTKDAAIASVEDESENAPNMVTESFDEKKAKVAKRVDVQDNIENAFKMHNAKVSKNVMSNIAAKEKALAGETDAKALKKRLADAKKSSRKVEALKKQLADAKALKKTDAKELIIAKNKVENKIENAFK